MGGLLAGAGALAVVAPGNGNPGVSRAQALPSATGRPVSPTAPPEKAGTPSTSTSVPSSPPDPAEVKANELGMVPVMMYHRIQPRITGEYDMTPGDFRAQLQTLFSLGMRPVRTIDLARGDFGIKAGYTPVVLTFDDGYANQLVLDAGGNVDPHSAVGILMDVCREFPDCTPAGSFNHDDLSRLDAVGVQEDFVKLQHLVESAVPGASVLTMALPFGISPHDHALSRHGSWDGQAYRNEGVLDVGANPSVSPFAKAFDPLSIPRIRGTSWNHGKTPLTAKYWIAWMRANRHQLYVSAGNPGHVTAPKKAASTIAAAYRRRLVTY
jgi:hypothetical protein